MVRSTLSEAERMDLVDARQTGKVGIFVTGDRWRRRSNVVKAIECSQPEVSRKTRSGVDPVLAAAAIAARRPGRRGRISRQRERLRCECRASIAAAIQKGRAHGDGIKHSRGDWVSDDSKAVWNSLRGVPGGAMVVSDVSRLALRGPDPGVAIGRNSNRTGSTEGSRRLNGGLPLQSAVE